ncbi:hypothetical protein GCM10028784_03110 [Myceligenerans cantabricum]
MTVHPGEDVELSDGVPPTAFREPLAALVRRPELRRGALLADGAPVPDDCRAGERPLLPGATLTLSRRRTDPGDDDAAVLRGPWVLTRATGPRAGDLVTVDGPRGVLRGVRSLTAGTSRRGTGLRLRRGGVARTLAPPRTAADPAWALGLLPALVAVSLAVVLRQPALALFALVGIAALLPQALRRRATPAAPGRARPHRAGPAALLAFATAAQQAAPGTWRGARAAWAKTGTVPTGWPGGLWDGLLGDGSVAVVGPDEPARAVARAIVADLATGGRPVRVLGATGSWTWCRWLAAEEASAPGADAAVGGAAVLVVDHGSPADHVAARRAVAQGATAVVVGSTDGCRTVVAVRDGQLHVTGPEVRDHTRPLVGVTTEWAERFARRLAGARHLGRTVPALTTGEGATTGAHLPDDVPLGSLHGLREPHTGGPSLTGGAPHAGGRLTGGPEPRTGGWAVPLGRTATGTVTWDLVADGPHLLVAGTTGSGKSEVLRALVLGLALQHPPDRLALGLVDFKGGAGLGRLTGLPHVVGQVTDLDAALAARALTGLQAELRRRKVLLGEHGVADIAPLAPGVLPRLVVVVDEFRALADELPDFLPGLVRIAAQGRSLGVHLVLATQRPAGAVSTDVRANVTARLALRVTDPLESRDVVGCADAATLPVDRPGRAVLRIGSDAPVVLQCAHTGRSGATTPVRRAVPFGRRARPDRSVHPVSAPEPVPAPEPAAGTPLPTAGPEPAADLVAAVRSTWADPPRHAPLWLPPLPDHVSHAGVAGHAGTGEPGLPLALGDLPERQRRTAVHWDPAEGNLAVVGRARSGRSTALAALGEAALARGMTVQAALSTGSEDGPLTALVKDRGLVLTDVGTRPPAPAAGPDLLLIDDLDAVRAARPGWEPPPGVPVAVATRNPAAVHACGVGPRLVMLSRDRADDIALGAPAPLAGSGGVPGRAAWCGRTETVLCQVVGPAQPNRSKPVMRAGGSG